MTTGALVLAAAASLEGSRTLAASPQITWTTGSCSFALGTNGAWVAFTRRSEAGGTNYLDGFQPAPLLSLGSGGTFHAPDEARWDAAGRRLALRYPSAGMTATVRVEGGTNQLTLELIDVQPPGQVDIAQLGPLPEVVQ